MSSKKNILDMFQKENIKKRIREGDEFDLVVDDGYMQQIVESKNFDKDGYCEALEANIDDLKIIRIFEIYKK